jgi:hypothetical protein
VRIFPITLGISVLALSALTACGGGDNVTQTSSPTTSKNTEPPVANPLKTDKLKADMCKGLTPEQLKPYSGAIEETTPKADENSSSCTFHPADGKNATISVHLFPKMGPAALKAAKDNFPWGEAAAPIAGYYAQHVSPGGENGPKSGDCETVAAVSDTASVGVFAVASQPSYQFYTQMCTVSGKLVEQVVANLKAGG